MINILDNAIVVATALAFLISGIVEAIKTATDIDVKYVPLLSLAIGLIIGLTLAYGFNLDVAETVLAGCIGGMSASGLYDNIKMIKE
ncbi:hypothetical protein HZY86_01385 [Aerococcaceae bacterium DSM 111020]|nr:hypothetical protein [Aerococcaceae bacterium DSM 111020]